jgi:hypothetical protein
VKIGVNVSPDLKWQKDAACAEAGNRELFLSMDNRSRSKTTRAAMEVCKTCPVLMECGWYAKTHEITDGVWAGKLYGLENGYYGVRERNRESA